MDSGTLAAWSAAAVAVVAASISTWQAILARKQASYASRSANAAEMQAVDTQRAADFAEKEFDRNQRLATETRREVAIAALEDLRAGTELWGSRLKLMARQYEKTFSAMKPDGSSFLGPDDANKMHLAFSKIAGAFYDQRPNEIVSEIRVVMGSLSDTPIDIDIVPYLRRRAVQLEGLGLEVAKIALQMRVKSATETDNGVQSSD